MKKRILNMILSIVMVFTMLPAFALTASAASATVYNAEDLRSAIANAQSGHIITFGSDITVEGEWACCEVPEGVTIRGGSNTFKIGDVGHYDSNAAFYGSGFKVEDLTIERTGTDENGDNALQMNGGKATNVKVEGTFGSGIVASGGVEVDRCEFGEGLTWGVNTDGEVNGVASITKTEFNSLRAVALYGTETFTNNEVYGDKGLSVATKEATITGNIFEGERALSISADGVEISGNTIEGAVEIYEDCSADLSGNYWGENGAPADLPDGVTVTTYYTDEVDGNLFELPSGSGTEADPVLLKSAADLKWFRNQVNGGKTFEDKFVKLNADIDLENEDWTPIGNEDYWFSGSFDGGENTIYNLTINDGLNYYDGGENYAGLFGHVKNGGYIKNLTIENVQITGCLYVGGVVGRMEKSGVIENCHLTGDIDIEGYWYVGGIAGRYEYGTGISGCSVKGTANSIAKIEADVDAATNKEEDGAYAGAIVGFTTEPLPAVNITNNEAEYVDIKGVTRVGGIAGMAHQGSTFKGNSLNEVNIYAVQPEGYNEEDADTIGQIAGACQGTATNPVTFEQCTATVTTVFLNGEVYIEASEYGGSITDATPVTNYVARIGTGIYFTSLDDALSAAMEGQTIELISGDKPISPAGSVVGKTVTITGNAVFDWSMGWLYVGRNEDGNAADGKLIFENATITSTEDALKNGSYGIYVSMAEYGSESTIMNGEVVFKNSTVDLSYLNGENNVTVDNSKLTIWKGFTVGARPASETNGTQNTATMTVKKGAVVEVKDHNNMGVGYQSAGVLTLESGATFKYTGTSLAVTGKGIINVNSGTFIATEVIRASGGLVSVSGESTVQIDKYDGAAVRIEDGAVLTNSWIKSTNNGTTRIYGDVTFKGGFETAYLTTADEAQNGRGGTITIEDGTTVKATYGVDLRNNYTINGGTIEMSGGNDSGQIWGFNFWSGGEITVNSDIVVNGLINGTTVYAAPIYVSGAMVTLNGNITQSNSNDEAIYIRNGTLTVSKDGSITTDSAVNVNQNGTLKSAGDISGKIEKNDDTAIIEISGGTYTQDVGEWCIDDYKCVMIAENTYKVTNHKHVWSYQASGYTITATCADTDCYCPDAEQSVALVVPENTTYTGTVDYTAADYTGGIDGVTPTISYKGTNTNYDSEDVPVNADTYTVTMSAGDKTVSGSFTITKASITPSVSLESWTYGANAKTPTVTGNPGNGAISYQYTVQGENNYSATVPTDAGNYTVKAIVAASANYQGGEATADFTIAKQRIQAINDAPGDYVLKQYHTTAVSAAADLKAQKGTVSYHTDLDGGYGLTVNIEWECVGEYNPATNAKNEFKWQVSDDQMENYDHSSAAVSGTITVTNVSAIGVTHEVKNVEPITYNGSTYDVSQMFAIDKNAGEATYSIVDGGTGEGTLNGSVLTITKAGTIEIKMTTAAKDPYDAGTVTATLTVNKGTQEITVSMDGWTYGDEPSAPTSSGIGEVTYVYTDEHGIERQSVPTEAGNWTVIANYSGNDLYNGGRNYTNFVIAQKEITPTISGSAIKDYDGTTNVPEAHNLSITLSGVLDADEAYVSATADFAYEGADVGTTSVKATNITLSGDKAKNYELTATTVSADSGTITKVESTCTPPDDIDTLVFNGSEQALITAGTAIGGEMQYKLGSDGTWGTEIPMGKNAGNYKVFYRVVGDGNHEDNSGGSVVVIIKQAAAPTVTIDKQSFIRTIATMGNTVDIAAKLPDDRGETSCADLDLSGVEGIVSEDLTFLTPSGSLTFGTMTSETVKSGKITLVVIMENYANTTVEVEVELTDKTPLSITGAAAATGLIYNGEGQLGYTGTPVAEGYDGQFAITYSGRNGTTFEGNENSLPVNAGDYTVTFAIPDEDLHYTGQTSVDFTIGKAQATVTADNKEIYIGNRLPELTYEAIGLIGDDTISVELSCDANTNRYGEYPIVVSATDPNGNYDITTVDGTLKVKYYPYIPSTPTYPPVIEDGDGGDVVVTPAKPEKGDTVIITPDPDPGKEVDTVVVIDENGNPVTVIDNGDGTYSFEQPKGKVTILVTFKDAKTSVTGCKQDKTCPMHGFTDLDVTAWYHDGVHFCIENDLMNGTGATTFAPGTTLTRSMLVTILWRLEGEPVVNYLMNFDDVTEGKWYSEAIRWAASEGIVNGYGNGLFGTNDAITREQLATILYRYEQYKGGGFTGAWMIRMDYVDLAEVSDWAYEAMCWMNMNGIINGKPGKILDPKGSATRAEASTMLYRYCDVMTKEEEN